MVISDHPNELMDATSNNLLAITKLSAKELRRRRLRRSLRLLPNIFTLGNAFAGFCAIIFAAHNNPQAAAYCIFLGASLDMLDGRIARFTNNTSMLGMQLDSLADAITFCLAPAFMMYSLGIEQVVIVYFFSCAFYLLAGLFRLARFNITSQTQSHYFLGLPTTLAGCCLATIVLIFPLQNHDLAYLWIVLGLGYLMISRWRFPTFKQASKRRLFTGIMMAIVIMLTFGCNRAFLLLGFIYFVLGIVSTLRLRGLQASLRNQKNSNNLT
jgi:CDP-diacylglycerol---serine O-phosphatidyltransferase